MKRADLCCCPRWVDSARERSADYGADPAGGLCGGTKFAVEGITEALRKEVGVFGIGVMAVESGAFRTDFLVPGSIVHAEQMPAHLPIGEDALTLLDTKLREVVDGVAPWRERSIATAHDAAATT